MTATVESAIVREIALANLCAAEWNARKTFDPAALERLEASIAQHGIQVPLLVRPLPSSAWRMPAVDAAIQNGEEFFEIVAGHRRSEAAKRGALETVPCIVRDLGDDEAREIGLVDNLQREDVPALEEADAYAELQQRLGTAAAIAARVGKSVAYVAQRLKLVDLCDHVRRALALRLITVDHALLLARLGEEEQEEALRWTLDKFVTVKQKTDDVIDKARQEVAEGRANAYIGKYYAPQSVQLLRQWIEEHTDLTLGRAPWDLTDAELIVGAGPCTACPKNTGANTLLFGDLAIEEASCTDAACFNAKRDRFVQITLDAVKAAGKEAVRLSWVEITAAPSWVNQSNDKYFAHVFKRGHWVEAKPGSCGFVRTGVTIDYPKRRGYMGSSEDAKHGPAQQISVCIALGCKVHPKAWQGRNAATSGTGFDAKAYEQEQEKRREAALVESKLRLAAAGEAIEKVTKLPEAALRGLLLSLNIDRYQEALLPGIRKHLETAPLGSVTFARAVAVLSIDSLQAIPHQEPQTWRKEYLASLKRLGHDASKHWEKPKAAKKAAKAPAKKAHAKKTAKKGGRK